MHASYCYRMASTPLSWIRHAGHLTLVLWVTLLGYSHLLRAQEVIDMAGRQVHIPDVIARPFGAAPPITALLYALAPDLVIALNMPFTPESDSFLQPGVAKLPIIGSAMGHGHQVNSESLLALKPDLALAWSNSRSDLEPKAIEIPFAKAGIPVVYIKLESLADWPPAFEYVGRLLGREARGKALADYIRQAMASVETALTELSGPDRLRVYYAESPNGLATECNNSFHAEPIELAGGYNVYRCEQKTMVGREPVDLEQILLWNPQLIIVQDPLYLKNTETDERWRNIDAFKMGRIFQVPRKPINWLDRPPSFMRALGIQWLAHLFYPSRYTHDIRAETRNFYHLFLGVDLSDAALNELLPHLTSKEHNNGFRLSNANSSTPELFENGTRHPINALQAPLGAP
ncbi:MAG: ABC transporter substrate-binding protein [Candidatus Thiodiazotropha sp.]|jgi:iron complex transport system substrate-binding protein